MFQTSAWQSTESMLETASANMRSFLPDDQSQNRLTTVLPNIPIPPPAYKQDPSNKSKPQKQSRRHVVTLFATGGALIIGTAGVTSFILPRLFQEKTPQTQNVASSQDSPHTQPTANPQPQNTGAVVASTSMPTNIAHSFTDPASGNDSILVHLASGQFVAYNRACTHAQVLVNYDPGTHQLICPAHGATFDPANAASVTQGPADTPLARVTIHINNDGTITAG
jgi:Rieske Fe-S protein